MIVVDGNDGTGKTTSLVEPLRALGYLVADRGLPTRATDEGLPPPARRPADELYLILDAPPEVCQARLARAGRSLEERYHTLADLTHYRRRFLEVAAELGAPVIDASGAPAEVLAAALARIGTHGRLRVGVPKGRLLGNLGELLARAGYPLAALAPRQLKLEVGGVQLFLLKPRSIPQLVALELLDVGFAGRDLVVESGCDDRLRVAADLGLNPVVLCAATPRPELLERPPPRPLRLATEFPLIAARWAMARNLAHISLLSWGSTEAWAPDLADLVVDVVETGETMRQNGLTVVDTILESTTVLFERADRPVLAHTEFGAAVARVLP